MKNHLISVLPWQVCLATITFLGVATIVYHDLPTKSALQIGSTLILLLTPAIIAGFIGYSIGRILGHEAGVWEAHQMAEESWEMERLMKEQHITGRAKYAAADLVEDEIAASGEPSPASNLQDRLGDRVLYGRLGDLVVATQNRYWNVDKGFDPANRDSFTPQQIIIDWIKSQGTGGAPISTAEATAVEKVACPIKR